VGGYVLYQQTIVTWWYPVAAAAVVAAATAPVMYGRWRIMTTSDNAALNILCHLYVIGSVAYFAFLCGNYVFADTATGHKEEVTVVEKYKKTHRKYRTVGRRRRVQNGTYDNFFLRVEFSGGTDKELSVTRSVYNKTRNGSVMTLYMQKGLFGFPVMKR